MKGYLLVADSRNSTDQKSLKLMVLSTVPQTDTGAQVEKTKAYE